MQNTITPSAPSETGDRIREVRQHLGLSQKAFCGHLHISQSTLSQIENGYYYPSFEVVTRLVRHWNVDCNWLIVGIGAMNFSDAQLDGGIADPSAHTERPAGIVAITEKAIAGYSANHRDEYWLARHERYVLPGFNDEDAFRIFKILGDSMEPTVHDQDFVVCARIDSPPDTFVGQVVLAVTEEEVLLKRLANYSLATERMSLASDNPKYKTVDLGSDDVSELWYVTGRLTRNLAPTLANQDFRLRQLESSYQQLSEKLDRFLGGDE